MDFDRLRSDIKSNSKKYSVIRDGAPLEVMPSRNIKLGDIVKVNGGEEFPCDLVLLASSNRDGHCHIQTAQLDGETNMKKRTVLKGFEGLGEEKSVMKLFGAIRCDKPNEHLYKFQGRIEFEPSLDVSEKNQSSYPLTSDNLLLRGSILKNTKYVYGIATYVGKVLFF